MKNFLDSFKTQLGPPGEKIIIEDVDTEEDARQSLAAADAQLKRHQELDREIATANQEVQTLREKEERTQAQIDVLTEEGGALRWKKETKLNELKQLKKNYQKDLDAKVKKLAKLRKQGSKKRAQMAKEDTLRAEVGSFREQIAEKQREQDSIKASLDRAKRFEEEEQEKRALRREREQLLDLFQSEDSSPADQEAGRERLAEIDERLARLETQDEREMPLSKKIKDIFKKYGVAVTAVLLAAGVTIGAVVSTITKALAATGKALGAGLKEIGAKLGSMLLGLIGQVASFLFKTAGQVVSYLAEHTWLLILATVVFLFEKYIKKRPPAA